MIILGKGSSADEVEHFVFEKNLVIGINDAEWIAPTDVAIFHEDWVARSIDASGRKADLYLTTEDTIFDHSQTIRLPYRASSEDSSEMMARFMDPEQVCLEEVMLVTALKIAKLISKIRSQTQEVFLVGMDFSESRGYSSRAKLEFDPMLSSSRVEGLQSQKFFLLNTLYMLKNTDLRVHHVGTANFSNLSPQGINSKLGMKPVVSEATLERPEVLITAEITTNHFGDRARIEKLVTSSKAAGADFVKFQIRNVDTFYSKEKLEAPYVSPFGNTFGDYRRALELDQDDFEFIDGLCQEVGIRWFLSVLDKPSFDFILQAVRPEMIKLPSTISEHLSYLEYVSETYHGPLVISTGMTDSDYEAWILDKFSKQEKLFLLHANSAYPTPEGDCNIAVIRRYSQLSETFRNLVPGWSSHDPGWLGSALAVAAGAGMLEKHVKLGVTEWAHFDSVALDLETGAFRDYVQAIRRAQDIVGTQKKKITPSEHHKYFLKA